jgi:UTP--glucose-1-phosphate uridylyltransferase
LPDSVSCAYIRQKSPQGLGHAVLCAKQLVMNEPFAVLLADDLIDGGSQSCLKQMVEKFEHSQASIVAVERILAHESTKYGIVDAAATDVEFADIRGIVEKPEPAQAPSNLGVVGRYILTPRIFTLLENTSKGSHGEIQLTDAIAKLLLEEKVYAYQFHGKRYDCGSKLGYLEATIAYALKHPELAIDFKRSLENMVS